MSQSRLSRGRKNVSKKTPSSRSLFGGRMFYPSEAPPVFAGQPWNQIQLILPSPSEVKISTIKAALLAQTGCSGAKFEFRIQSFALWSSATKVAVAPYDFCREDTTTGLELTNLMSTSMRNAYARVGYIYPITHQQRVIYSEDTDRTLISIVGGSIEMHLKVLWRGAEFKLKIVDEICITSNNINNLERNAVSSQSSISGELINHSLQDRLANIERLLQDARVSDG